MKRNKFVKAIIIISLLIALTGLIIKIASKPVNKSSLSNPDTLEITCPDTITVLAGIPPIFDKIATVNDKKAKVNISSTNADFANPGEYNIKLTASVKGNESNEEKSIHVKVISRDEALAGTEFVTGTGHAATYKDGIFKVDGIIIANKSISLSPQYGRGITKDMLDNFAEMKNAAAKDGINLFFVSSFRSFATQEKIYNNYVTQAGQAEADTYSARPGSSEHQIGDTADLNLVDQSFENTKEGKWLSSNASKYGFILRYPKGKEQITGYIFEPWHFKFVGKKLAKKLYQNGSWSTLEEYYGLPSNYDKRV